MNRNAPRTLRRLQRTYVYAYVNIKLYRCVGVVDVHVDAHTIENTIKKYTRKCFICPF